jgi:hypothetical protein
MSSYVSIEDKIKECSNAHIKHKMYQLQSKPNDTFVTIKLMGEFETIPAIKIFDKNICGYNCTLLSYSINATELFTSCKYDMIGFTIYKNNVQVGLLNYVFVPNVNCNIADITSTTCEGHFEIIFKTVINDIPMTNVISTIKKCHGQEKSIYVITEALLEYVMETLLTNENS